MSTDTEDGRTIVPTWPTIRSYLVSFLFMAVVFVGQVAATSSATSNLESIFNELISIGSGVGFIVLLGAGLYYLIVGGVSGFDGRSQRRVAIILIIAVLVAGFNDLVRPLIEGLTEVGSSSGS